MPEKPKIERDHSLAPKEGEIDAELEAMSASIDVLLTDENAEEDPDIGHLKSLGGYKKWLKGQLEAYKRSGNDPYWSKVQIRNKAAQILRRYK